MNKSSATVGTVIAISAIWIGSTWYTGQQIEKRAKELSEQANTYLRTLYPNGEVQVSLEEYQRNIFSSQSRYTLHINNATLFNAPLNITFSDNIEHGPFPLSQLKRFNFSPQLATVQSQLVNTNTVKSLFEATKGIPPYHAVSQIGYNGNVESHIDVIPLEYQKNEVTLKFSGADLKVTSARNKNASIQYEGNIGEFSLIDGNTSFLLQDMMLGSVLVHPEKEGTDTFKQSIMIKQVTMKSGYIGPIELNNLKVSNDLPVNDKTYQGNVAYSVDKIKIQGKDFGSSYLNLNFNNLDISLLQHKFLQPKEDNTKTLLQMSTLDELLKTGPEITIAPWSWKNSQGESEYKLSIKFQPIDILHSIQESQMDSATPITAIQKSINELKTSLKISVPMAKEVVTKILELDGLPKDKASQTASKQIDDLQAMGIMFNLFTTEEDKLVSNLNYADGIVNFNGKKTTVEKFIKQFSALSTLKEDEKR